MNKPAIICVDDERFVLESLKTELKKHLNNEYIGTTQTFHQLALDILPGIHRLTLVDDLGNRLVRKLEILGKE